MKSWLPWIVAVAALAGAYYFFSVGQAREAELAQLRPQAEEVKRLQAELAELKQQLVPAEELARMRKDLETLPRLRGEINQLRSQGKELSGNLQAAQRAQAVQQEVLSAENAKLRNQSQQSQEALNRLAQIQSSAPACLGGLRALEVAKTLWAADNSKPPGSVPTFDEIKSYLGQPVAACAAGGDYALNAVGTPAACSVHGSAAGFPAAAPGTPPLPVPGK